MQFLAVSFIRTTLLIHHLCYGLQVEINLGGKPDSKQMKLICAPEQYVLQQKRKSKNLFEALILSIAENSKQSTTTNNSLAPAIKSISNRITCFIESPEKNYSFSLSGNKVRFERELAGEPGDKNKPLAETFFVLTEPGVIQTETGNCPPGYRISQDKCYPCFPGSYTSGQLAECILCPKDFYTTKEGSDSCWPCPRGKKTLTEGADSENACVSEKIYSEADNIGLTLSWLIIGILLIIFLIISWILVVCLCIRLFCFKTSETSKMDLVQLGRPDVTMIEKPYYNRTTGGRKNHKVDDNNEEDQAKIAIHSRTLHDSKDDLFENDVLSKSYMNLGQSKRRQLKFDVDIKGSAILTEHDSSRTSLKTDKKNNSIKYGHKARSSKLKVKAFPKTKVSQFENIHSTELKKTQESYSKNLNSSYSNNLNSVQRFDNESGTRRNETSTEFPSSEKSQENMSKSSDSQFLESEKTLSSIEANNKLQQEQSKVDLRKKLNSVSSRESNENSIKNTKSSSFNNKKEKNSEIIPKSNESLKDYSEFNTVLVKPAKYSKKDGDTSVSSAKDNNYFESSSHDSANSSNHLKNDMTSNMPSNDETISNASSKDNMISKVNTISKDNTISSNSKDSVISNEVKNNVPSSNSNVRMASNTHDDSNAVSGPLPNDSANPSDVAKGSIESNKKQNTTTSTKFKTDKPSKKSTANEYNRLYPEQKNQSAITKNGGQKDSSFTNFRNYRFSGKHHFPYENGPPKKNSLLVSLYPSILSTQYLSSPFSKGPNTEQGELHITIEPENETAEGNTSSEDTINDSKSESSVMKPTLCSEHRAKDPGPLYCHVDMMLLHLPD